MLGKENDFLVEDGDEMWESLSQMPAMEIMPGGASAGTSNSPKRRKSSTLNLADKIGLENMHRKSPRSVGQMEKGQKSYRM